MSRKPCAQVKKWLEENALARVLLEKSHLDPKTLETMLLRCWDEEATFEDIASRLHIQRPGAWKRWQKGREAVLRSFYTIELAIYAGILEAETAELLAADLLDYISLARGEVDADEVRDRIEKRLVRLARVLPKKLEPKFP